MPRLATPYGLHPSLQFRYMVNWTALPGAVLYARAATQPTIINQPVELYRQNHAFYAKGRTVWEPLTMQCYQFEGITRIDQWINFISKMHVPSGATDFDPSVYLTSMMIISILTPQGAPIGNWNVHNPWIERYEFGQMDWGSDDIMETTLTIRYDWAQLIGG